MKHFLLRVFFIFLAAQHFTSNAQIDTSFWFAVPWVTPDHWWRDDIKLHISTFAAPSTTVRVRQPSAIAPNRYDTTIVISANSTFDYTFWRDKLASPTNIGYDSLETRPADVVLPYGLYISSSSNVTVVYDVITRSPLFYNPETFSLKGRNALGTQFLCPFQTKWVNATLSSDLNGDAIVTQPKQQINIVTTQSNTVVWITPKCNIVNHLANVTFSVLLPNPGSVYTIENSVQTTTVTGQNLSGTAIISDKPIAVTVTDDSAKGNGGCFDLMGDQIVSFDALGKDYIVIKGSMNSNEPEGAFIVAKDNNTQITINDGTTTTATVNAGDTYHYPTTQPVTYISTDKNVYVLHATGFGCELGEDILPPLNCSGSNLVSFSRTTPQKFTLNILCKNGSQNTFTLNGSTSLISSSAFTVVPGTSTLSGGPYYGAQVSLYSTTLLPIGSYTLGNNTDVFALGVFDGNTTTGTLYHYMSSFMNQVHVTSSTLNPLCVSSINTVALTGTVSGAELMGLWTTNGTGTFAPYSSTVGIISTTYSLSAADTSLSSIKFYLNSAGGCVSVKDSVMMSIHQRPQVFVGNNVSVCKNSYSSIALTGTVINALSGLWSGGNGTFGANGPNTNYIISAADTSSNFIVLSLTTQAPLAGCSNAAKSITVNFIPSPVVNTSAKINACSSSPTIVLNGSVSGITNSGIWAGGSGTYSPTNASPGTTYILSAGDISQGQITLTLSSTNNGLCLSVSKTTQILIDSPVILVQASSYLICAQDTISLTAGGANTYTWNTGATSPMIFVSPGVTTTYTVTGTDLNGCKNSFFQIISVNPLPAITVITSNSVICAGETATLTAHGALTYSWNTLAVLPFIQVSPSITTLYTVNGTDSNGCANSSAITQSVSECTGLREMQEGQSLVLIYPNPNKGEFVIRGDKDASLKITNQLGQLIKTIELNERNGYEISVGNLANGIYFINGIKNKEPIRQKIVVDK